MKYKVFFFLFFLFLLFYLYISHLNNDLVKFYFGGRQPLEMSVADFVFVSFVLGVIVTIIVSFFYDIRTTLKNWRDEKKEKKGEEIHQQVERALGYDQRGDREKAIESLTRITRKNPAVTEPYLVLSDLYVSMKEFDKAIDILDLAEANLGKREPTMLKKAGVFAAIKDGKRLEAELKEVLKLNESNLEALASLRDYAISKKDWNEAYDLQKKLKKYIKTEEEEQRFIGIRYERISRDFVERFDTASDGIISDLKEIISEDKRFVPAYILLAEAYKRTRKPNEAGRVYGRGYSKTGHIVFLLKMEDLYIDRGDPGVILKIYRRILDISPKNHLISFLYARLCLRLEMIDEAIDMLNTLFAEGEDFAGLHRAMAEAYIHHGEMERAVEEFRKAFPMKLVYIPFSCDNCQQREEEWVDFCETCLTWNSINVKREDFLVSDSKELRMLYEEEDWARGGQ